jgi:hypothetical protein
MDCPSAAKDDGLFPVAPGHAAVLGRQAHQALGQCGTRGRDVEGHGHQYARERVVRLVLSNYSRFFFISFLLLLTVVVVVVVVVLLRLVLHLVRSHVQDTDASTTNQLEADALAAFLARQRDDIASMLRYIFSSHFIVLVIFILIFCVCVSIFVETLLFLSYFLHVSRTFF